MTDNTGSQTLENLPYIPLVPYNGTTATGGNPLEEDLNVYYQSGDIAWMIMATALVLLMIPGVGFFYSGLARRKSALSLICLSVLAIGVVSFQWFFWGYSFCFSHSAGVFFGNLENIGYKDVLARPSVGSNRVPDLMFANFQGMFAAITVALATGATAERGRVLPCVIFMFLWTTIVYDAIAEWTWNPNGWSYKLGVLDFAGGAPVHMSSGAAALAYAYALGKRTGFGTEKLNYRPHNVTHIIIGTVFLWVGWFGFNAGSALAANMRAVMAAVVTHLAACTGGLSWCLMDYRYEGKWSTVGFCSGVVAGLVAITPGCGYVPAWAAIVFGICAGIGCNLAVHLKYWMEADDALDVFAIHAVGGLIGELLTGIFADSAIARLDGVTVIKGGWLNGNWIQLPIQLADAVSSLVWSFVMTYLILMSMRLLGRFVPALKLRVNEDQEEQGVDDVEIGEFAYDFVEHSREAKPSPEEHDMTSHSIHSTEHFARPPTVRSEKTTSVYTREISRPTSVHALEEISRRH